jgi:hypothetical protein
MRYAVFIVSVVMLGFESDQVEFAMTNTTLGHQRISKLSDISGRAFKYH